MFLPWIHHEFQRTGYRTYEDGKLVDKGRFESLGLHVVTKVTRNKVYSFMIWSTLKSQAECDTGVMRFRVRIPLARRLLGVSLSNHEVKIRGGAIFPRLCLWSLLTEDALFYPVDSQQLCCTGQGMWWLTWCTGRFCFPSLISAIGGVENRGKSQKRMYFFLLLPMLFLFLYLIKSLPICFDKYLPFPETPLKMKSSGKPSWIELTSLHFEPPTTFVMTFISS